MEWVDEPNYDLDRRKTWFIGAPYGVFMDSTRNENNWPVIEFFGQTPVALHTADSNFFNIQGQHYQLFSSFVRRELKKGDSGYTLKFEEGCKKSQVECFIPEPAPVAYAIFETERFCVTLYPKDPKDREYIPMVFEGFPEISKWVKEGTKIGFFGMVEIIEFDPTDLVVTIESKFSIIHEDKKLWRKFFKVCGILVSLEKVVSRRAAIKASQNFSPDCSKKSRLSE